MAAVSSKTLHDLSFAGSTVKVGGITIRDFMDDANPLDFPDVTVANVGVNLNGIMARHSNPTPVVFSVTVIPGSDSDVALNKMWCESRVESGGYNSSWGKGLTATIVIMNGTRRKTQYSFRGGTMLSGPGGPSATGDGKMQGRTYTFGFAAAQGG